MTKSSNRASRYQKLKVDETKELPTYEEMMEKLIFPQNPAYTGRT